MLRRMHGEAQPGGAGAIAHGGQFGAAFVKLARKVGACVRRQPPMRGIGGQIRGETVEANLRTLQIGEDVAHIGQADAQVGLLRPAAAVVRAQGRAHQARAYTQAVARLR